LGFFDKIKEGLSKTKKNISVQLNGMFAAFTGANEEFFEELEETLILADLGVETVEKTISMLREVTRREGYIKGADIEKALIDILAGLLEVGGSALKLSTKPAVILVIGVNGVGKTTTIGKLALKFKNEGKKVLLCAGDTFRAAAAEQLGIWAQRAGVTSYATQRGATLPPWFSTVLPRPRPGVRMSSSAIRRAGSIISKT
jgi:fused signal recognition particle receptor